MRGRQWDGTIGSPRNAKLEHRYFCQDTRDHEAELVQLQQGVTACIDTTWGLLPVSVELMGSYPYQGVVRAQLEPDQITDDSKLMDKNKLSGLEEKPPALGHNDIAKKCPDG